jgi:hypothetical protein
MWWYKWNKSSYPFKLGQRCHSTKPMKPLANTVCPNYLESLWRPLVLAECNLTRKKGQKEIIVQQKKYKTSSTCMILPIAVDTKAKSLYSRWSLFAHLLPKLTTRQQVSGGPTKAASTSSKLQEIPRRHDYISCGSEIWSRTKVRKESSDRLRSRRITHLVPPTPAHHQHQRGGAAPPESKGSSSRSLHHQVCSKILHFSKNDLSKRISS